MLEALPLFGIRRSAQDLEPSIHLDRVAVDRHGVLAPLTKPIGDGDRHAGLAHGRRAEEREDLQAARLSSRSDPPSVVEVALSISTSTSSPERRYRRS